MAKNHGQLARAYVNNLDISGVCHDGELDVARPLADTTAWADPAWTGLPSKIKTGLKLLGFYDVGIPVGYGGFDESLWTRLTEDIPALVGDWPAGSSVIGTIGYEFQGYLTGRPTKTAMTQAAMLDAEWGATGPPTRAMVLANATVTGTGAQPNALVGSTTANDTYLAIVRILAYQGSGSITIEVEHSSDAGVGDPWTTLVSTGSISLAASSPPTAYAVRLLSNSATKAYQRVNISAYSGLTSATVFVAAGSASGSTPTDIVLFSDLFGASVWSRYGIVLPPSGGLLPYEAQVLYDTNPQILAGPGPVFKMWHAVGFSPPNLSYAESADAKTWTRWAGGNIVTNHIHPAVLKVGSTYYLYAATSAVTAIDLFTSTDGVHFTLDTAAVIVPSANPSDWDGAQVANSFVWNEGGSWYMLYEAFGPGGSTTWKIGLATSSDGRTWTKYAGNPVIQHTVGVTGAVGHPWLTKIGSTYYCWTHGNPDGGVVFAGVHWTWQSTDLHTWTKVLPGGAAIGPENADDALGGSGADHSGISNPALCEANGASYYFYDDGGDHGIHLQTAAVALSAIAPGRQNAPSARWLTSGNGDESLYVIASRGAMAIPGSGIMVDHPVYVDPAYLSARSYLLEFTAELEYGTRFYVIPAYIDADNHAQIRTNGSITQLVLRLNGVDQPGISIGSNPATDGTAHIWKVTRTPSMIKLVIDGLEVGRLPLDMAFNGSTTIGFSQNDSWPLIEQLQVIAPRTIIPAAYVPTLQAKGASGIWLLQDATGNPVDSSGNGRLLTANGTPTYQAAGPLTADGLPYAMSGWSTGNWLSSSDAAFLATSAFTVGLVVHYANNGAHQYAMARAYPSGPNCFFLGINQYDNIQFSLFDSGGTEHAAVSTLALGPGWHLIAATFSPGGTMHVYLDGAEAGGSIAAPSAMRSASTPLGVGLASGTTVWGGGLLGAFFVPSALAASDILAIYRSLSQDVDLG